MERSPRLRARAQRWGVVVHVVLSPCDWKSLTLGKRNALPREGAIDKPENDAAWLSVVESVRALLAPPVKSAPSSSPV
jgi:hypothetical protein